MVKNFPLRIIEYQRRHHPVGVGRSFENTRALASTVVLGQTGWNQGDRCIRLPGEDCGGASHV